MGVCLLVAVIDWATARVGPEETYTAGNWEARRKPTSEEGEGQGGLLERSFLFLAPSLSNCFMRVGGSAEETLGLGRKRWPTPLWSLGGPGERGREGCRSSVSG